MARGEAASPQLQMLKKNHLFVFSKVIYCTRCVPFTNERQLLQLHKTNTVKLLLFNYLPTTDCSSCSCLWLKTNSTKLIQFNYIQIGPSGNYDWSILFSYSFLKRLNTVNVSPSNLRVFLTHNSYPSQQHRALQQVPNLSPIENISQHRGTGWEQWHWGYTPSLKL